MDTSDAPPENNAAAAGFLAPSDLAAAKAQVISKSGKRGWLDWRKRDWDRWGAAPRATAPLEVSEGRAFVLAKVPLKERYDVAYGGEANIHTPHMLIERIQEKKRRLSCVVDATLRRPGDFHDVGDWEDWDVERVALRKDARPCARFRDAVPLNKDLDAAVVACGKAWKHPSVVVFLSVDGCNTAGLCAVATLIDLCGVAPLDAWNGIRAARPIFSEGHVALLNARYPGNNFGCDAAPAWYGPQVEGDAEDDPEIDDEAPPPQKKRERADGLPPRPRESFNVDGSRRWRGGTPSTRCGGFVTTPHSRRRRRAVGGRARGFRSQAAEQAAEAAQGRRRRAAASTKRPAPRRPADAGRPRDGARRDAVAHRGPLHDLRDVPAGFGGAARRLRQGPAEDRALRVVYLYRRRRPGGPRGAVEILAG